MKRKNEKISGKQLVDIECLILVFQPFCKFEVTVVPLYSQGIGPSITPFLPHHCRYQKSIDVQVPYRKWHSICI